MAALLLSACGPNSADQDVAPRGERASALANAAALTQSATLAATCSGCHAAGNTAMIDFATYTRDSLSARLIQYRAETGPTVMHRIARGYTDDQLTEIAAYLTEAPE